MKPQKNSSSQLKRTVKTGLAPGSVVYTGQKTDRPLQIDIVRYSTEKIVETTTTDIDDCLLENKSKDVIWMNINGLNHVEGIKKLGEYYGISSLILEDLVNPAQRPKLVEMDRYIHLNMKILKYDTSLNLNLENLSFVLFDKMLITFMETDLSQMQAVKDRLKAGKGRIRSLGPDYLTFALIDNVVDHYFYLTEALTEKIEIIEDKIFKAENSDQIPNEIQLLKKEVLRIRKAINPLNEMTNRLSRVDTDLIETRIHDYFKDLHDHVVQVLESIDISREMIWSLMDMYMNFLSTKMNEVMKVLTIISTIFIPLSFIAGVYGMNFEYMPELAIHHAYFVILGLMLLVIMLMLFFFRKKKWI